MAITARQADFDTPSEWNIQVGTSWPISGSIINVGDWIACSKTFPDQHRAFHTGRLPGRALPSIQSTYDNAGRVVRTTACCSCARVGACECRFLRQSRAGSGRLPISTVRVLLRLRASGVGRAGKPASSCPSAATGAGGSGVPNDYWFASEREQGYR